MSEDRTSDSRVRQTGLSPAHWAIVAGLFVLHVVLLTTMLSRNLDLLFNDAAHRMGPGTDFSAYYNAGTQWRQGNGVYGHGPGFGYRYHPAFAMSVGAALSLVERGTAFAIWVVLNELLLLISLLFVRRLITDPRRYLAAVTALLLFTPYYLEVYMGNSSFIVAALLLIAFDFYRRDKRVIFAAILTASLLIKPIGIIFFPILLARRSFRVVGIVLLIVVGLAIPYFWSDPTGWHLFWQVNSEGMRLPGWMLRAGNQGFHGLCASVCARLNHVPLAGLESLDQLPPLCQNALAGLPIVLVLTTMGATWILRRRLDVCIFLWSATYLLGYRDVWEHSYSFAFLGLAYLWSAEYLSSRLLLVCTAGLALPTAFALYDPVLASGPGDPEHQWGLGVALLHHVTKPLWLLILYVSCVAKAVVSAPAEPSSRTAAPETPLRAMFALRWRHALVIFLLALAYRGLYLCEASGRVDFNLFYMDQEYHLEWAKALVSGAWNPPYDALANAPYFRAPLYPFFLATLLRLFDGSTLLVRIAQMLMGSASCVLAYGVAAKCLGQRIGIITGALCALYWVLAYFDGELLLPVLLVVLVLLAFLLAFIAAERGKAWLAGLAGLAFGLYAITRPNILVFFPLAIWWAARTARIRGAKRPAWFAIALGLGCVLPATLVTVRNRVVGGDWVVIASQGGVNFYIGNNPESNGMQAVVPGTRETWWGGYEDSVAIAERAAGRPLRPSEVSRFWFRRAFSYIAEQPGHWVRLTLRKSLAFVADPELPNNEPYEARRSTFLTLRSVPLSFGLVFGFFVVALPRMLFRKRGVPARLACDENMRRSFLLLILQFMVVYSLSVVAFFVTGRYRVPLIPFVILGAATTLDSLAALLRTRRFRAMAGVLGACVLVVAVLKVDYFQVRQATRGFAELTSAQDQLDSGDFDGAIKRLEVLRAQRSIRAPELYTTLVRAYFERNRPGDIPLIAKAVQAGLSEYPDCPELLWYDVLCRGQPGQESETARALERYLRRKPHDVRALYLAFHVATQLEKPAEARRFFSRAEAVDAKHPLVARMRALLNDRAAAPARSETREGE